MTDRTASSTAVLVCQGRAVAHGRLATGRFSDPVAERLLDPAERTVVEQARDHQPPQGGPGRMDYELVRRTAVLMVPLGDLRRVLPSGRDITSGGFVRSTVRG